MHSNENWPAHLLIISKPLEILFTKHTIGKLHWIIYKEHISLNFTAFWWQKFDRLKDVILPCSTLDEEPCKVFFLSSTSTSWSWMSGSAIMLHFYIRIYTYICTHINTVVWFCFFPRYPTLPYRDGISHCQGHCPEGTRLPSLQMRRRTCTWPRFSILPASEEDSRAPWVTAQRQGGFVPEQHLHWLNNFTFSSVLSALLPSSLSNEAQKSI